MNNTTSTKSVFVFESVDLARTFREWKSPLLSAEFLFIQTFKELTSARKKLLEKERELEFYDAEMRSKWERLKLKQADFMSNIPKYNEFFIENEEKSHRMLCKINSKLDKQKEFDDEICKCEKRIQCLMKAEVKFEKSIQRLTPYRDFLEITVEKVEEFESTMELINYYALINSETQLLELLHQSLLDTEKKRILIVKCLKEKMQFCQEQNDLIFYFNKKCTCKINSQEKIDSKIQDQRLFTQNIMADVLTMKHSCNNIFLKLIKWKKATFSRKMDDEKKSAFIIETVNELQDAVKLAFQLYNKKDTSSQADSSFLTLRRTL